MLNVLRAITLAGVSVVLFAHAAVSMTILFAVYHDHGIRHDDPPLWYTAVAYLSVSFLVACAIFVYIALGGGR